MLAGGYVEHSSPSRGWLISRWPVGDGSVLGAGPRTARRAASISSTLASSCSIRRLTSARMERPRVAHSSLEAALERVQNIA